jgi:hypothetical protein
MMRMMLYEAAQSIAMKIATHRKMRRRSWRWRVGWP